MKRKLQHIILSVMMMTATYASMAQSEYQDQVRTTNATVTKHDGATTVSMNMVLDDLKINKNHMLILTPIISATDGSQSVELPQMIIKGNLRDRIINRPYDWKGKPEFDTKEQYMPVRKNNTQQTIAYTETIPQSAWHQNAKLWLKTEVMGCADCDLAEGEVPVMDRIFKSYTPIYTVSFVTPEVEPIKQRSEKHSAYFNYRQGRHELLYDYKDNAAKLDEVARVINEVKTNKDLTFTNIEINGYASPEGNYDNNITLSKNRANSFADFIIERYSLNSDQLSLSWHGEDWDGLRKALEESTIANKEAIIKIIDTEPNHDARDAKIMALDNGKTYDNLLYNFYPPLRRNDYSLGLIARSFDVEEAKEIIKTRPNILSLNEMFLVAQTYEKGSKEYNEVFEIAARVFPDDPVSNINKAASDLEKGDTEAALKRLEKLKDNPAAWNNLAIALAKKGDYDEAKKVFAKAIAKGDKQAQANAQELDKLMETL